MEDPGGPGDQRRGRPTGPVRHLELPPLVDRPQRPTYSRDESGHSGAEGLPSLRGTSDPQGSGGPCDVDVTCGPRTDPAPEPGTVPSAGRTVGPNGTGTGDVSV